MTKITRNRYWLRWQPGYIRESRAVSGNKLKVAPVIMDALHPKDEAFQEAVRRACLDSKGCMRFGGLTEYFEVMLDD